MLRGVGLWKLYEMLERVCFMARRWSCTFNDNNVYAVGDGDGDGDELHLN